MCGDGTLEGDEACDVEVPKGLTCEALGFQGGLLGCNPDCTLTNANCTMCGNDVADSTEDCDGADLGGVATCADIGLGTAQESLACSDKCTYDFSGRSGCGDGVITAP